MLAALREEAERDAVRGLVDRERVEREPADLELVEREPVERDRLPLLELVEVLPGVTAVRSLSNSLSAVLFAFTASRRTLVSVFESSL